MLIMDCVACYMWYGAEAGVWRIMPVLPCPGLSFELEQITLFKLLAQGR